MLEKYKIKQYLDVLSIQDTANAVHKITDGASGFNGAISAETLRSVGHIVAEFVPPESTYLDLGIEISNVGGVANYIASVRTHKVGGFTVAGNNTTAKGVIGVDGEEQGIRVTGYEATSSFTTIDLAQAKFENRDLLTELYSAHAQKYFEAIDKLGYKMLFNGGFDKVNSAKTRLNMNDVELGAELRGVIEKQRQGIARAYWADTVICSPEMLTRLTASNYSNYSDKTLKMVLEERYNIKFVSTFRASTAGAGGSELLLVLCTNRNSVVTRIPLPLKISALYKKGFTTEFESMFRVAGADIFNQKAGVILDQL